MDFSKSKQIVEEGSQFVAGGVNSNFRYGAPPNPLVFAMAHGSHLVDVDGNDYLDYYLGMGAMVLGHSPESIITAAKEQLDTSILVAGQTPLEYQAARKLVEMVPSAELVRFASSGTEAIHAAFRIARATTKRMKIIKFEGQYHGWTDNVLLSVAPDLAQAGDAERPSAVMGSEGQEKTENICVLRWNDVASLERELRTQEFAAVITEPIMFNSGGILPLPGYLEAMKKLCVETGTILIFDEVITGFRVSAGGAQSVLDISPDLSIFGKALANGFPVAAVAGRRDLFDLVASSKVLHGGTYNSQSVSMAATLATLSEIQTGAPHRAISEMHDHLVSGLKAACEKSNLVYEIVGYPAVFQMRFGLRGPTDYRSSLAADRAKYMRFTSELLQRGVRVLPRGTWFLSSAHTHADIDKTLREVNTVLATLQ